MKWTILLVLLGLVAIALGGMWGLLLYLLALVAIWAWRTK